MKQPERILFAAPNVDEADIEAVAATIRNGWVAPIGPELDLFESKLSTKFNLDQVLVVNSGTSALHLAVRLSGIQQGDRVIVGSFTFISAANVVKYEGGVPVFMDSEEVTWNLDPDLLQQHLKSTLGSGDFPKAVIVTHIFGIPAQIERIRLICDQYGVKLIEDAAEALGSHASGRYLGGFGDYGVISFNGNKLMTTSGGGALICSLKKDSKQARKLANLSREPAEYYLYNDIGYNYRMSNVLAGLGLSQLEKFDQYLAMKKSIATTYQRALSEIKWLSYAPMTPESNHWVNPFLIKKGFINRISPSTIVKHLEQKNIEARRFWLPLHLQPVYRQEQFVGSGVCEELFQRGVCLPSGTGLREEEVNRVVEAIYELDASIS